MILLFITAYFLMRCWRYRTWFETVFCAEKCLLREYWMDSCFSWGHLEICQGSFSCGSTRHPPQERYSSSCWWRKVTLGGLFSEYHLFMNHHFWSYRTKSLFRFLFIISSFLENFSFAAALISLVIGSVVNINTSKDFFFPKVPVTL